MKSNEASINTKIRIRVESFNKELLISYCQKIINLIKDTNIEYLSFVTLPTNKKIYCVLRSPHVDKSSREHFELRVYRRLFEIYFDPNTNFLDLITKSDLPSGIVSRISFS